MWEVLKLPTDFLPYKEYFPYTQELEQLSSQDTALYETYSELMCHFHICLDDNNIHGNLIRLKSWANYLFPTLDGVLEKIHAPVAEEDIDTMMTVSGRGDVFLGRMTVYTRKVTCSRVSTTRIVNPCLARLCWRLLLCLAKEVHAFVAFS